MTSDRSVFLWTTEVVTWLYRCRTKRYMFNPPQPYEGFNNLTILTDNWLSRVNMVLTKLLFMWQFKSSLIKLYCYYICTSCLFSKSSIASCWYYICLIRKYGNKALLTAFTISYQSKPSNSVQFYRFATFNYYHIFFRYYAVYKMRLVQLLEVQNLLYYN